MAGDSYHPKVASESGKHQKQDSGLQHGTCTVGHVEAVSRRSVWEMCSGTPASGDNGRAPGQHPLLDSQARSASVGKVWDKSHGHLCGRGLVAPVTLVMILGSVGGS